MEKKAKRPLKKDYDTAGRLAQLRFAFAGDNQKAFAENIVRTITYRQWNNYENGFPIPRDSIRRLIQLFPGLSADWILFGDATKLSPAMAAKLGVWPAGPNGTTRAP